MTQLALFPGVAVAEPIITRGRLLVQWTEDGRTVLHVETNQRGGAWLELLPADQQWLAQVIVNPNGPNGR